MNAIFQPSPASIAEISAELQVLFDALPFQRRAPDNVAAVYVQALRGNSHVAIHDGISRFLRGECEDVSLRYVPTPPELAKIVRTTVSAGRVPAERVPEPEYRPSDGERDRMRLKMPMWRHAFGSRAMLDELMAAYREGFEATAVLAMKWGVPVPDELFALPPDQTEREWRAARLKAEAEMQRNPPPFMRRSAA
ncbi:MAG: hypothetical protein AB7I42_25030 [Bradyrhizobium sp.]|uniref:hypothetical protein n=1 Tax=Bradyrhizobium sp. TaxID=376 RepID=UPI003D0DAC81